MTITGNLQKMRAELDSPVKYFLVSSEGEVPISECIGRKISLAFNGQINCMSCGVLTKKSFGQGFCYPCFQSAPENSECIVRPELCEGHLGRGRDVDWEVQNHVVPHTVYLALSSAVKVGVTRNSQIPTRWIDQGASSAIRLAEVPNRYLAGVIEVELKKYIADKTNWQRMLKNDIDRASNLLDYKSRMSAHLGGELSQYITANDEITEIDYPVMSYPSKVSSVSFDKSPVFEGILKGIKGQYLILEDGRVLNVRKHSAYHIIFRS